MKKNFVSKHLNSNNKPQANRKNRSLQLEALETRQLLSAASIMQTAIANDQANDSEACKVVNQNTFTVQSNLKDGFTDKVIAVYIQGNNDATFQLKEGDPATLISQVRDQQNDDIACLLVKMGVKSSFTLTTTSPIEEPMTVFVTHPLDLDGDGVGTEQEYYQVQGSYMNTLGQNQRYLSIFFKQHGIDLNTLELPKIFDVNDNGKIDQDEWKLASDIQDMNYGDKLDPSITTTPQVENMQVGGASGTAVPGAENSFVIKGEPGANPAVTFNVPDSETLKINAKVEYTNAAGQAKSIQKAIDPATEKNISIALEGGVQANSTVKLTLGYDGIADSEATYSYTYDSVAPSLVPGITLNKTEGAQNDYTATLTPNFNLNGLTGTDWTKVGAELDDPAQGIVLVLKDNGNDLKEITLKKEDLAALQAGTYKFDLTLTEGPHTITISARDLAGNLTAASSCAVTTDTIKPLMAEVQTEYYVDEASQKLVVTVTDKNLQAGTAGMTMTSDQTGKTYELDETPVISGESISYKFTLPLAYGKNVWTFTATDKAGNSTSQTFTYDYNKVPVVGEAGTKLNEANIKITTNSTEAKNNKSQNEVVGTITDGKLNLGKVSNLFNEQDGSTIQADKDHVTIENLGSTVSSWEIVNGEIILTLATFGTETKTFSAEDVKITYTDDYKETASVTFDLAWTNDTAAPSATLEPNENLIEKEAENEYYYTGTANLDLTFKVTDFSAIKDNKVTIYGKDYTIGADDKVTVTLTSPVHNTTYEFKYTAEDEFGNKVENALICKVTNDQKVDVDSATIALDGTSQYDKKAEPTFKAQFTNLTEPATLILYCDGEEVASVDVASGATEQTIASTTLTKDGVYKYTAELVDAAGNTTSVGSELTYYFDTTAPTVSIDNSVQPRTGVESSDFTLMMTTEDATSGVASVKITQTYTDAQGTTQTHTDESTTNFATCAVTLEYGENKFTYTATDKAGNTSKASVAFPVIYNVTPTATGAYYKEAEQKFVQTLSKSLCDENDKITLDLKNYFTDEAIAKLAISDGTVNITSTTTPAALTGAEISGGKLILQMTAGMEQGEPDRISNLAFTLKDEFGKTLNVSFDITYLFDSFAPKAEITTIKDANNKEITANDNGNYYLTGNAIKFDGKITDDTAIRNYGYKLVDANYVIVKDSVGNDITGTGSFVGDATKEVALAFTTADTLTDGQYTLIVWGKDTLNPPNESTEDGTGSKAPQKIVFVIDNTAPTATSTSELQTSAGDPAASQSLINFSNPRIAYTVTPTDASPCKLYIYRDGTRIVESTTFTGTLTNDTPLADGEHTYTYKVVDAAGNESQTYTLITFTVDTTAPTLTVTNKAEEVFVAQGVVGKAKFDITANDANKLEKLEYTTDGGENWTALTLTEGAYTGKDVEFALTWGENNFQFRATDKAGNVTTSNEFTVDYDHIPAVTDETLVATPIVYDADKTEYTVQFTVKQISDLFVDKDCDNGDTLDYTCVFTGTESVVTDYDWEFNNGVWNLKLTVDPTELKKVHDVGTLVSITATDSYEQSATKTLNLAITKENLPPEAAETSKITVEQGTTSLDLSEFFTDPEGDAWTISSASATNGVTATYSGQNVTVTLPQGKAYGTFDLTVKASDGTAESAEKTISVTIDWSGVTSVSLADITIAENAGEKSYTATIENAFDADKALGGYTKSTTFTVMPGTETVNGYVVTGEGDARTRTACTTLTTTAGYSFANGVLTFTTAQNAYGNVTLTLSAKGEVQTEAKTTTTTLTITNVPTSPYAPTQNGGFTLTGGNVQTFDVLTDCDAGEDSGDVSFVANSLKADGLANGTLTITKDNHTYTLTVAQTTDGFTVQRDKIDGQTADDKAWEALNGTEVAFSYTIHNGTHSDATKDTTGTYNLTLNAIAKSVTISDISRSKEAQSKTLTTSDFTEYPGFYVSAVTPKTSVDGITATLKTSDHSVTVNVADGAYGNAEFIYTLTNGTDSYTASIYVNVPCVNFPPVQAKGVLNETSQNEKDSAYVWTVNKEEYDFNDAFEDPYDDTDLTIELDANYTVTDGRTGFETSGTVSYDAESGKVTFTPEDKDFYGTVEFTLKVTDEAVGGKAAETSEFDFTLTINNTADAPRPIDGAVLTVSGKAGDVIDLSDLKDQFYSPDGNEIASVKYNGSTTYTIPADAAVGVNYLEDVQVADSKNQAANADVTLLVNGTVQFTDQSLYAKKTETNSYSGKLSASKTLPDDVDLTATTTLAIDSVIKSGSTLAAGSSLAGEAIFSFDARPDWLNGVKIQNAKGTSSTTLAWDAGSSSFVGTIGSSEYKLTWDETAKTLTNDSTNEDEEPIKVYFAELVAPVNFTIAAGTFAATNGSTLLAGTVLAANSVLGQKITITETVATPENVVKMYVANQVETSPGSGTYTFGNLLLREELSGVQIDADVAAALLDSAKDVEASVYNEETGKAETKTLKVIAEPEIPADAAKSQYKYMTVEDGVICLYHGLYNINQDRADRTFTLNVNGGELEITTAVKKTDARNNDCVAPYEVNFMVIEGTVSDSLTTLEEFDTTQGVNLSELEDGTTYTLLMYVRNNLPLISDELGTSPYGNSQASVCEATLQIENVTNMKDRDVNFHWTTVDENKVTFSYKNPEPSGTTQIYSLYNICAVTFTATANTTISDPEILSSATFNLVMNTSMGNAGPGNNSELVEESQIKSYFYGKDALKGTSAAKETVVEGNGVYMSLVKEKSVAETSDALPESEAYITEWDTSYLELWVNTQKAGINIANFKFDVNYDSTLFTASDIEFSSCVTDVGAASFKDGCVEGISGKLANAVTNEDGFVLVGRVKLNPVGNGGIAAETLTSASPELSLENIELRDTEGSWLDVNTQTVVNTKVFAVVYDANDDGTIDIKDLVAFAKKYGTNTTVSTDTLAWALDFDNNGQINIQDLVSFAKNYGASQANGTKITYPTNYFQTWIGTTLEMSGDSNVADTLDDALDSWSEKLGEELNLNVQIIVKEYANEEFGTLAEASLIGCDEAGKPDTAVIYLDSDALGMGWYVGESGNVQEDQYDLYTVLLHELGHALGMTTNYSGYNDFIRTSVKSTNYRDEAGNVHIVIGGHVYAEDDLMNETIDVGVRREISDTDAEIVKGARANGGEVLGIATDSILGTDAEAANFTIVTEASAIMPEARFNQILTEAATKAVLESAAKQTDAAWQEFENGNSTEIDLSTAATDDAFESLFNDEDFASVTEEIARENLTVELDEE